MNIQTFLAYKHGPHPARDGRGHGRVELEVGVIYDVALEIDQRNNWLEVGEMDGQMVQTLITIAARGLSELMSFCFNGQALDRKGVRIAIRRFLSVAWLLHSEKLIGKDGKPLSLENLSKLPQVDCTRCALSLLAQEFGDRWGFRARVQKRVTTKPHYAHSARGGWKKRRRRARDRARRVKSRKEKKS